MLFEGVFAARYPQALIYFTFTIYLVYTIRHINDTWLIRKELMLGLKIAFIGTILFAIIGYMNMNYFNKNQNIFVFQYTVGAAL